MSYDHAYGYWQSKSELASAFADSVGDGSGSVNAATLDGSSSPVYLKLTAVNPLLLHRIVVTVEATGTIDSGGFDNGAALANGLHFGLIDPEGNFHTRTPQLPITKNTHFGSYSYDMSLHTWGSGDQVLLNRYTFSKDGAPLVIRPGWSYALQINDDLAARSNLNSLTLRCGATVAVGVQ